MVASSLLQPKSNGASNTKSTPFVRVSIPLVNRLTEYDPPGTTRLGGTAPESAIAVAIAGLTNCPFTTEFNVPLATIRSLISIQYASIVAVIPGNGCMANPTL